MVWLVSRKPLASSSTYPVGFLDLVMKSWSEGRAKQYEPHLRRWFSFRSENWLQPFNADVTRSVEFFTQYFRKSSCEYSSVNTACSALSSILPEVDGFTFGKPLIKRLSRGIFKERLTFPRYTVTCDVTDVLAYVKKCYFSGKTSLELTLKVLATTMCLFSGQRSQTLVHLSTDYMCLNNSGCVLCIPRLSKTSRPKSHQ